MTATASDTSRLNTVLVGMPGCGKSTVGVILAKHLSRGFVDTDLLIQEAEGRSLQDIVDGEGYMALRSREESLLLSLRLEAHVISTGGSAIYSSAAMSHLKAHGIVVFLNVDIEALTQRISDFQTRGLAKRPDQSFRDLFDERYALYRKYADITVESSSRTQEEVSRAICAELRRTGCADD